MYLTRMKLDTNRRSTMIALASPNKFHGAIESSFPGNRARRLWRIDTLRGDTYLMLLSDTPPNLVNVYAQFGSLMEEAYWETKDYTLLLNKISENTKWHFHLTACPVRSICRGDSLHKFRGKVSAHITVDQQKAWLVSRAEKNGFSLYESDFDIVNRGINRFYKGNDRENQVTLSSVTYEGILTVQDVEKFKYLLIHGIGKGKAYGLGMMTIIRYE